MNRGGMAFTMKSVGIVLVLLAACALSCVFAARELDEVDSKSNTLHVPDAIRVPSGYKLHLILCAEGDQYYQYNGTSWVDYAAKAKLLNREKKVIGRHFYLSHPDHLGGQPSWETLPSKGVPESLVTGVVVETTTVDENSIQWVLLKATNNSGDKKYLGEVVYIQRINTSKGLGPTSTSGAHKGDVQTSSYTSDYAFYIRN
ncbi:hypothetical protein M758_10G004000 [Ceratodon purpureus]|uniref:Uncharacterized protein n=1 Tax=Ceratodon purpureus TaxID=3225 RepID=A0A8T0GIW6_CERPU|nr:hypothetical protein KC19_10G005200 [Ceratodon purpureus]KAG0602281.1 hypothetical protein M758_10G004000 [Ceratodon purpureus]